MGKTDVNVMTGTKVPALRLKGYSDEWVERQILDEVNTYQPKSLNQGLFTDDGYPVYGANGQIGYYSEYNHENRQIAVACRGNTAGVVNIIPPKSYITGNAMVFDIYSNKSLDFDYMAQLFTFFNFDPYVSGSGQPQITRSSLIGVYIPIPTIEEQQQIGQLFKSVDSLVTTEQQKLEQLQSLKKSFLQKMLPKKGTTVPELRFDRFSGDWVEKKLGDVLSLPEKEKVTDVDDLKLMTLGLWTTGIRLSANRETLSLGSTVYYKRNVGQLLYGKQNFFNGSMAIIPDEADGFATSGDVPALDIMNAVVDSEYLYQYISRPEYYKHKEIYSSGTGSKRIHEKTLFGFRFVTPPIEEQQAIGQFFKTFDELIAKQEEKVENGKSLKKALLQKMFV